MIISHKYKFIFIKTYKTAGSSIEDYLSRHCGESDVITPEAHDNARNWQGLFNPLCETILTGGFRLNHTLKHLVTRKKYYDHIPAYRVKCRTDSSIWRDYFTFAVERNPWDKVISNYYWNKSDRMSFDEYIATRDMPHNYQLYTHPLSPRKILVDRVIRYENLNEELGRIFADLGVPYGGELTASQKSGTRKDRRPYQEVYTDKQKDRIARLFRHEIALHSYKF